MPTETREKDRAVLQHFIEVYCRNKHGWKDGLCDECADLMAYAAGRLAACPLDPKPACKDCKIHCYAPEYRTRIVKVMKFSGMYFVKRGRIDWLVRYFMR